LREVTARRHHRLNWLGHGSGHGLISEYGLVLPRARLIDRLS
jgi:hypothetical protein